MFIFGVKMFIFGVNLWFGPFLAPADEIQQGSPSWSMLECYFGGSKIAQMNFLMMES
jgi:hypothetical protein